MNAHSAWMEWQEAYRVRPTEDELEHYFPCPVRYDWKGIGMEGAFKAGYMAYHPMGSSAIARVRGELSQARLKHGPLHNRHEAYAVIKGEVDEFWAECKKKNPDSFDLENELVQIAAMAIRAIEDICR